MLPSAARASLAAHLVTCPAPARREFRPADANATRLLFSPTARSLRTGEGYIGVYEFLLPFVQVGITDRLSMGVGTPLIFFGDDSGRPVWLTPKYQFYKGPRTSAAVGVMPFVIVGENVRFGLAYTVVTTGGDDDALTVGAGWAYARYHEDEYVPCFPTTPAAAAEGDAALDCDALRVRPVASSQCSACSANRERADAMALLFASRIAPELRALANAALDNTVSPRVCSRRWLARQ